MQLREAAGNISDVQREAAMMRQALKDKERQIALLTAEVERLQGRPVSVNTSCKSLSTPSR